MGLLKKARIFSRLFSLSQGKTREEALTNIKEAIEGWFRKGTSYNVPVKRENEKNLSFIKTTSYKTFLVLTTPFPLNPMTDLSFTRRLSRP